MARIIWEENAWKDYCEWQNENSRIAKKINMLIKDAMRNPFTGLGKPEHLKGKESWSRRIDIKNRLVYIPKEDYLIITSCKFHYNDK